MQEGGSFRGLEGCYGLKDCRSQNEGGILNIGEEVLVLRLILEVWMLDKFVDGWKRLEEWIFGCMLFGLRYLIDGWIFRVGEQRGLEVKKEQYRVQCDFGFLSLRREVCGEGFRGL